MCRDKKERYKTRISVQLGLCVLCPGVSLGLNHRAGRGGGSGVAGVVLWFLKAGKRTTRWLGAAQLPGATFQQLSFHIRRVPMWEETCFRETKRKEHLCFLRDRG